MGGEALQQLTEGLRAVGAAEIANTGILALAVVGIFLTVGQLLLLRRQLKLDALIKITDSNREIVGLGLQHPAVWTTLEGSPSTLLAEEALMQRRYLQLWMNHMQLMWGARRLRLVTGEEWQAYRRDMGEFLKLRTFRTHWSRVAPFYPKGFQRLVVALLQEGAAG